MFQKSSLTPLTKLSISGLSGGPKHAFFYFVGISESAEIKEPRKDWENSQRGTSRSSQAIRRQDSA